MLMITVLSLDRLEVGSINNFHSGNQSEFENNSMDKFHLTPTSRIQSDGSIVRHFLVGFNS